MYGFHGRLLQVDLDSGKSSWHDLAESRLRSFLGGIGLGTSLLCDYAPPGVDPFSPANPLIFTSAPLVGTGLTTTAKFGVVTKSPLTGFIGDSLSSSHFALELKRAGLDAVVITGQRGFDGLSADQSTTRWKFTRPSTCAVKARGKPKRRSKPSWVLPRLEWRRSAQREKTAFASRRSAMKDGMPAAAVSAR